MQLEPDGTTKNLLLKSGGQSSVALAGKTKVQRQAVRRLQHRAKIKFARRASRGTSASGRPGATANHRRESGRDGFVGLLRTDVVNVGVEAARSDDEPFTR